MQGSILFISKMNCDKMIYFIIIQEIADYWHLCWPRRLSVSIQL